MKQGYSVHSWSEKMLLHLRRQEQPFRQQLQLLHSQQLPPED